jgi:hypothetical protein
MANVVPSSPILVTPMMEALVSSEMLGSYKSHTDGVTSKKTTFFIVTAMKSLNLTLCFFHLQAFLMPLKEMYVVK